MTWLLFLFLFSSAFMADEHPYASQIPIPSETEEGPELFSAESLLSFTIHGDIKSLLNDRGDDAAYHELELIYTDSTGQDILHPLKIRARGNFRRKRENCFYPPLLLNFPRSNIPEGSPFSHQNKLKLVTPCKADKFVLREYLAYKLYEVVSQHSFKVRMVKVTLVGHKKMKARKPFYGFLIEDEDAMAERNERKIRKIDRLNPRSLDRSEFLKMTVFQFMIGNTDWSVQYRHNIKIISDTDSVTAPMAVPYDFDHSGLVNAPYALAPPELDLGSVRVRRYRGYCMSELEEELNQVFAFYQSIEQKMYTTIESDPFLPEKEKIIALKYIKGFYDVLKNEKERRGEFMYPCLPNGTGNIIIRGLNN